MSFCFVRFFGTRARFWIFLLLSLNLLLERLVVQAYQANEISSLLWLCRKVFVIAAAATLAIAVLSFRDYARLSYAALQRYLRCYFSSFRKEIGYKMRRLEAQLQALSAKDTALSSVFSQSSNNPDLDFAPESDDTTASSLSFSSNSTCSEWSHASIPIANSFHIGLVKIAGVFLPTS
jgi:hypothetical protein